MLVSLFVFFLSSLAQLHCHLFFSFSVLELFLFPSLLLVDVATEHGAVVAEIILVIVLMGVLRSVIVLNLVRVAEGILVDVVVRVVVDNGSRSGLRCNWLWLGVVIAKVDLVGVVVFI